MWAPAILDRARSNPGQGDALELARLRDALLLLDGLRDSLGKDGKQRRTGGRGRQFDPECLLACMRLMMDLRSRQSLPTVVTRALEATVPTLADGIQQELQVAKAMPHASTLSRSQASLDAAIFFLQQERLKQKDHWFYILADSSPQRSYNFLLSTMLVIADDDMRECFHAAQSLSLVAPYKPVREATDEDTAISEEDVIQNLKERAARTQRLMDLMTWVTNFPQCLGLGCATLPAKARALLHIFWMLSASSDRKLQHMKENLGRIMAFTTDMGTEMGLAEYVAPCVRAAMAP